MFDALKKGANLANRIVGNIKGEEIKQSNSGKKQEINLLGRVNKNTNLIVLSFKMNFSFT